MEHTAKFGNRCPNQLVVELSATGRLYQGVQRARRIDLGYGLVVNGLWERARERFEESL
jgi:hypothetical protein